MPIMSTKKPVKGLTYKQIEEHYINGNRTGVYIDRRWFMNNDPSALSRLKILSLSVKPLTFNLTGD